MKGTKTADEYYAGADSWRDELAQLRELLLASGLSEEIKWGAPCYTIRGKNVVGVGGFKSYFGLWFYQGALMSDPEEVLINAQEGKTRALRQWRMTDASQIRPKLIKPYVFEARKLAESGQEIRPRRQSGLSVPDELRQALDADSPTKAAFDALRPAQQREFAQYVTEAKRADTRQRRCEKILPMIREGAGLNDRYRR